MISVMITDDHKMVRQGMKKLIEFDDEIRVIAEANDGNDCLTKLYRYKPDVLILDINMPDTNGMEVFKSLRRKRKARPKTIMLTMYNDIEYLIRAVDMGVEGYMQKNTDSHELIRAIKCVNQGGIFVQPSLIPFLNSRLIGREFNFGKAVELSERELDVLKLLAKGYMNKEIADILCISEQTVKNHLFKAYKKIGCSDRTQAAVYCVQHGLIGPE